MFIITGMEAWSLVAPLIAAHSVATHTANGSPSLNALDEAYIVVFGALKDHDKKQKEKRTCRNCKHCQDWAIVGFEDEPCASCLKAKKCFTKWEARE